MQFFDIKANKLYNFLHEMPLETLKNKTKADLKNFPEQYDEHFNFYSKGKKITVFQINKLFNSNKKAQHLIIAKRKTQNKKIISHQNQYDSHREKIEEYLKQTKENDVNSIKQNAQFIFQRAIDGNFKFRAFDQYDSINEFNEERKKRLVSEIFGKICQDPSQTVDVIDWTEKQNEHKNISESARKNLQKIEQKVEQNDDSDSQKPKKPETNSQRKVKPQKLEIQKLEKGQKINLQLHELMYITDHWRQIQAINKYLLKSSSDNFQYYEAIPNRQNERMGIDFNQPGEEKNQQI